MTDKNCDPEKEGHRVEWQDRARVVSNPKKDLEKEASPMQSPIPEEDVEEKSEKITPEDKNKQEKGSDTAY